MTALGHKKATDLPANAFVIIATRTPKPARYKKRLNKSKDPLVQNSVTTFCSADAFSNALARGWTLVEPAKRTNLRTSGKTKSAIAKLSNDALYAFPLNTRDFNEYANDLGLVDATSSEVSSDFERWLVAAGASYPKPPKAKLETDTRDVTTFYSPSAEATLAQSGWGNIKFERLFELSTTP